MKFIHLTDTHVVGGGVTLYGANPAKRLGLAVDSINAEHADAEQVIVTGDLTNWGDEAAYAAFFAEIERLRVPYAVMMGNHDDSTALHAACPHLPRDNNGFVQQVLATSAGPFILTDTKTPDGHHGRYCAHRLAWLDQQLTAIDRPALLFMHHPPFAVGIRRMDDMNMSDGEALFAVLDKHRAKVRHMFFGHLHRVVSGSWRGFPLTIMRGLNHQVRLDLDGQPGFPRGNLDQPAYGVVMVDADTVAAHLHCFLEKTPEFEIKNPDGTDERGYATSLIHPNWRDF